MHINPVFIPATYGKHVTNGHSNHKRAEEEILRRRDELDKLEDKTFINAYIKNNPLVIEDIFNFRGGGLFDDYTLQVVNKQLEGIHNPPKPIGFYNIIEDKGQNV
jgi:hypothetical protein